MRFVLVGLVLSVACGGNGADPLPDGGLGTRTFGQPCATLDDCVSGLCLATGTETSVCTQLCTSDTDCPDGVSWGCVTAEGFEPQVCGCVADADEERCGDGIDNDCNGSTDDCRICDGSYVADDDPAHCGECGNACGPGNVCLDGECVCANADEQLCDGACVDTSRSPFHCGRCGGRCEGDRECVDGECGCPDERPDLCEGRGCVDLSEDQFHCGECGVRCPIAQRCVAGECTCPADGGSTLCGSDCVDTDTDARHCGACGNVCPFGTSCVDGECDCGFGAEQCGSACVQTSTDPANCGACGNACRGDQACIAGTCRCPTGSTECGGVCIDTSFDPDNCGACGVRCGSGAFCTGGTCTCGTGEALCGGGCIDVSSDPANCGRCGASCAPGEFCFRGTCTCSSRVYCDTTCMPVDDRNNCGTCGNVCGASQSCVSGSCRCALSSQTACGDDCYDLRTDEANCGSCGNACRPGELCTGSRCACPSGQTWCESAGTCVSLSSDAANCGSCGNACRATEVCSFNTCRCPSSNQAWCDGACIDVASDEANCGSCGNACADDATCTSRVCRCTVAGQTSCGEDGCRDLQSDAQHCGGCGNACAGGQYCATGTCLCPVATPGAPIEVDTSFSPIVWDSVWDGTRLVVVQTDNPTGLYVGWIDGTGATGRAIVPSTFDALDEMRRLRVTPSSVGWNVLLQTADGDTGATGHHLLRLASDGSVLGTRQLDSTVAPWVEADLTYVPGTGPVVTWITGTPSTAFVRRLNEDGSNAGSAVVVGSAAGIPSIAHDGASELAITVANGSPARLRTFFLSTSLVLLGTHDDTTSVAIDRPFVQGRSGEWLVAARTGSSTTRMLRGARLASASTRPIANPRSVHWVGDEVSILSGGLSPYDFAPIPPIFFRRFESEGAFAPIDAALTVSSWSHALGVARVSPTTALVVGTDPDALSTFGAILDLGDCPR